MSRWAFGIVMFFSAAASAKPAIGVASVATPVVGEGVAQPQPQLRVVGRLNVNTAGRDQLAKVPGLDAVTIEKILEARVTGPIKDLDQVGPIPDEARAHLKVDGESNFTRILQNPLQRFEAVAASK